ncbi:TPA: hypothetical protein ACF3I9_004397 [Klebsiella aerogenes]
MTLNSHGRGALLLLCIASLLCGCNDEEKAFEKCQKEALANPNVWVAYQQVKSNYSAYMRSFPTNEFRDIAEKYRDLAARLFIKALDQNNIDALNAMFDWKQCGFQSLSGCKVVDKIPKYIPIFLSDVDKLPGKKSDVKYFLTAAKVYDEGHWVIKDSNHAIALYTRAWSAGAVHAPENLWAIFTELKEPASAYLWGIRCTGECSINSDDVKALTQNSLTAKQIRFIQQLAKDSSVITVNGLASREDLK